jgi:LysM domain-containing protein
MRESEGLYRTLRFIKRAFIGLVITILTLAVFGYLFFMRHVDARAAWATAAREVRGGTLQYGERVERFAKAFQRRPADYYRASNGLLVATNYRLIFIGLAPSDKLDNTDAPATILQYEFPNDTLLRIEPARLYFLTAHGVRISRGRSAPIAIAAAPGEDAAFDSLVAAVNRRIEGVKRAAAREQRIRAEAAAMLRQPIYYVVRRGDALSSIAARFGATDDQIRAWNNRTGDKIKIGERLIVKPEGLRKH